MAVNPYESSQCESRSIASGTPNRRRAALAICLLTVLLAVISAIVLCATFVWLQEVSTSDPIDLVVLLIAWMLAPNFGAAGIAFLFRRRLVASILVLLGTTGVCGFGTYSYCEYWWSNHLAELAGREITDVVLPIELVGPVFQWIGVVSTATIALMVSIVIGIISSWIQSRRRDLSDSGSG